MAEEFADFIIKLNQEPVEEQLEKLKEIVSVLVVLIEKLVKNCDMEFSAIKNKIISLETKKMNVKLPKIKVLAISPPPPPPQKRPIGNENLRSTIMGELKNLFDNRNK